jgi:hypothetical protein
MKRILPFLILAFACSKEEKLEDPSQSIDAMAIYKSFGEWDSTLTQSNSNTYNFSINDETIAQLTINLEPLCVGSYVRTDTSLSITNQYPVYTDTTVSFFEIHETEEYWYMGMGKRVQFQNLDTISLVPNDTLFPLDITFTGERVFIFKKFLN